MAFGAQAVTVGHDQGRKVKCSVSQYGEKKGSDRILQGSVELLCQPQNHLPPDFSLGNHITSATMGHDVSWSRAHPEGYACAGGCRGKEEGGGC